MSFTIYQVDAFTDKLFGGNPAAVVPLTEWLPAETMQFIAAENNISETAFIVANGDDFDIRWFTPTLEIDLCGHATLASAHVLYTELGYSKPNVTFRTLKAGDLVVKKLNDLYELDFPSRPATKADLPNGLTDILGSPQPTECLKSRDYLLVFESETDILAINPDFSALGKLDCGVIVTAKGDNSDFVSRFFIPSAGVNEDPVTGSTHCNLIPYWAEKLGKNKLHAFQVSARKGELFCESKSDRVLMAGKAVTYLKGDIYL